MNLQACNVHSECQVVWVSIIGSVVQSNRVCIRVISDAIMDTHIVFYSLYLWQCIALYISCGLGDTGVRANERLSNPPPRYPGAFSGQRQGWQTQEDLLALHCFCVSSGSALLGDLFRLSRSMECYLLYYWFILGFFACIHCVLSHIRVLFVLSYSTVCWCLLVVLV